MYGLGLRNPHFSEILQRHPRVDFFEAISENYMGIGGNFGGRPLERLLAIRSQYPVVLHGVSLSIGSIDPLSTHYLKRLKRLIKIVEPLWVSDHLCWTGANGENLHDLLPLPYTRRAVDHVSCRISRVQDFLGCRLLIENVSSYITFAHSEMAEWEFIREIALKADCELLLDINNVFVSGYNHGFDGETFLAAMPKDRIRQFHLAGHLDKENYKIDTHGEKICDSVWRLYQKAISRFGNVPLIIERDSNIPPLKYLLKELQHARKCADAQRTSAVDAVDHHRSTRSMRGSGRSESASISA